MARQRTKKRGNGEGTITKRKDGRWEARITVAVTVDGKAKQRSFYGKTREEVAAKLNDALHKQSRGMLTEPSAVTVSAYLDSWLDSKHHLDSKTRSNYAQSLEHVKEALGEMRLQRVKPLDVQRLHTSLAEKGLAPRSQRYAASLFKSALNEAVILQLIARNPAVALRVKMPRVESVAEVWNREEAAQFMRAARGELIRGRTGGRKAKGERAAIIEVPEERAQPVEYYPIYYLMLALGLRRGEALGLRWRDVDLDEGLLRVRQTLTVGGNGKVRIKEVKTPASRRSLYLSHDVVAVLREHRERLTALFGKMELVFVNANANPVDPNNLGRAFRNLCDVAGVKSISLHDLRHTYASLALQRGVAVEIVSERLGHTSVGFTLDTYRHLYDIERREAALSLDDLFSGRGRAVN